MARLLLDNLEDDLTLKLAQRAAEHERSVEDEVRAILRAEVGPGDTASKPGLGTRIAALFAEANPDGFEFESDQLRSDRLRRFHLDE